MACHFILFFLKKKKIAKRRRNKLPDHIRKISLLYKKNLQCVWYLYINHLMKSRRSICIPNYIMQHVFSGLFAAVSTHVLRVESILVTQTEIRNHNGIKPVQVFQDSVTNIIASISLLPLLQSSKDFITSSSLQCAMLYTSSHRIGCVERVVREKVY